jgi:hypothetical protein
MIYSRDIHPLDPKSVQWRMHINPNFRAGTMSVRLLQVPAPANNPGGFLAYPVDQQELDLPWTVLPTVNDVYGMFNEATMQVRLPGID